MPIGNAPISKLATIWVPEWRRTRRLSSRAAIFWVILFSLGGWAIIALAFELL
jgi:hypothetical protein